MSSYTYTPLETSDSIRILVLSPGYTEAPLHCHLVHRQLSEEFDFSALSYTWGEAIFNATIQCEDQLIRITGSLAAALIALRDRTQALSIWIDQVCIDQKNVPERNSQVLLMNQIYSSASEVFIWLGGPPERVLPTESSERFSTRMRSWLYDSGGVDMTGLQLQHLVWRLSEAQRARDKNGDDRDRYQLGAVGFGEYFLPWEDNRVYYAVLQLVNRKYFSRGWILQEAVLARKCTVRIGEATLDYMDLVHAMVCCLDLGFEDSTIGDGIMRFMSIFGMRTASQKRQKEDLLTLLLRTRATHTTELKDKVYCLLSLSEDSESLGIRPDYSKEISADSVYRDLALRILHTHKNLDILSTPRPSEETPLPSWVPDWRLSPPAFMVSLAGRDQNMVGAETLPFQATKDSRAVIIESEDPNIIGLRGLQVDTVEECGQADKRLWISGSFTASFRFGLDLQLKYLDWKRVALLHTSEPYITGETREDAFWRSLIASYAQKPGYVDAVVRTQYRGWSRSFFLYTILTRLLPDCLLIPLIVMKLVMRGLITGFALMCFLPLYRRCRDGDAFQGLLLHLPGRIIVRTKRGYIGLAPETTRDGDTVTLLEGGNLPILLRRVDDHWTIVGDCYLHGLMDGEGYEPEKCSIIWIA